MNTVVSLLIKIFKKIGACFSDQIQIKNLQVFSVLSIARELGLTELQQQCENIIQTNLNTENACAFLSAAMQVERDTAGECSGLTAFLVNLP